MDGKKEHLRIVRDKHGQDCYKRWGKKGGNPRLTGKKGKQ